MFGCSELVWVQGCCFTCPKVLKNLSGLSRKGWPGLRVSNDFVPAPIISVEEDYLDINRPGLWRRFHQAYLPVFIFAFEYLHENLFYMMSDASSIASGVPLAELD